MAIDDGDVDVGRGEGGDLRGWRGGLCWSGWSGWVKMRGGYLEMRRVCFGLVW